MSLRYFLPVYLLAYIIAAFFWRSYVVWKKTGVNPVVFKGSDSAHDFIGRIFKALFAVTLLVGVILIGIQVRLEEEYLTSTHGDTYTEYRRRVRRWI